MIEFKSRVRYNVVKGNDKIKTGEKFIIHDESEYDDMYVGYTVFVFHNESDEECFQFWVNNTWRKDELPEKLKLFESMLEGLEIEPDKEFGLKLISDLEKEIQDIQNRYSITELENFECIMPTQEERKKMRTEVTTLK